MDRLLGAEAAQTAEVLGRALGLAGADVRRQIDALAAAGCTIDEHPQHGVRLIDAALAVWADYLEARHAERIGRRVDVYRQTSSTQDVARQLIQGAADVAHFDGAVIVADHQTAGRGRLGRRWSAPPGTGLLLTVVDTRCAGAVDRIVLGACCAAAEAVEQLTGLTVQIRWPNDLLIDGRKFTGILVENVAGAALVGIGMNVSLSPDALPDDMRDLAGQMTSLTAQGVRIDRLQLLDVMLDGLEASLHERGDADLVAAWRDRSSLLQCRVTVQCDGRRLTGRVIDLDPAHGLLLAVEGGPVTPLPAATTTLVLDG